jgi:protein arginine N-methyltransferase 3
LRAGGLMVPSQCRIMANLVEVPSIIKENITFWDNVYGLCNPDGYDFLSSSLGFNMSSMAKEVYDDALVEVVSADAVLTNDDLVKVRHLASEHCTHWLTKHAGHPRPTRDLQKP